MRNSSCKTMKALNGSGVAERRRLWRDAMLAAMVAAHVPSNVRMRGFMWLTVAPCIVLCSQLRLRGAMAAVAPAVALLLALLGATAAASDQPSRCVCARAHRQRADDGAVSPATAQPDLLPVSAGCCTRRRRPATTPWRAGEARRGAEAASRQLQAARRHPSPPPAAVHARLSADASLHPCRWYITDDKGMVCPRDSLDYATGCCSAGELHSCDRCPRPRTPRPPQPARWPAPLL